MERRAATPGTVADVLAAAGAVAKRFDLMHGRVQVRGMAEHLPPVEHEVLRPLAEGGGRVRHRCVAFGALWRKIREYPEPRVGCRLAPPVRRTRPGEARTCA